MARSLDFRSSGCCTLCGKARVPIIFSLPGVAFFGTYIINLPKHDKVLYQATEVVREEENDTPLSEGEGFIEILENVVRRGG